MGLGANSAATELLTVCRVCDLPGTHQLGAYALCERHYGLATRERAGIWRVDLLAVAALVAIVIVAYVVSPLLPVSVSVRIFSGCRLA